MAKKAKISGGSKARSNSQHPAREIRSRVSRRPQGTPNGATPAGTQSADARRASLRNRWDRVSTSIALTSALDAVENITARTQKMKQALSDVRSRGYQFGSDWESRATELSSIWSQSRQQALQVIQHQQQSLRQAAQSAQALLRRAETNDGLIDAAESRVDALEATVREAEQQIHHDASFDLLPDEHGIAACRAVWSSDPEEPEGLLFLTDARLIFEQKQEVAKKKFLFITTEKELVQRKLWESPIGAVEEMESEDKGAFLRRKQLLTLRFSERTRETPGDVVLELKGVDNETWRSLIKRAKTGEIEADRLGAPSPQEQLETEIAQESASPNRSPVNTVARSSTSEPA